MNDDAKSVAFGGCVLAAVLPLCFVGCYGASHVQVSDGFRDCTVRKVSHTGIVFKTWEVECIGDGLRLRDSAAGPETFEYSVSDSDLAKALSALPPGQKVRLHYRKQLAAWTPKGESRYFVTSVEQLNK